MAPHKPTTDAKPHKKPPKDKVVKRPARGYHKYRNGLLNVTPKGAEMELVKNNENSPLLRLPPEIRKSIWEYTLGGAILKAKQCTNYPRVKAKLQIETDESSIGVALLRSCRQIYSEAALIPLRLSILVCMHLEDLKSVTKVLKPYQRKQITTVHAEINGLGHWNASMFHQKFDFTKVLPAVKHIQIDMWGANVPSNTLTLAAFEAQVRHKFGPPPTVQVTVEGHDSSMPDSRINSYYCRV